ncbi:MAG: hypothetical protein HYR73_03960 [Candidatus Eisenbacteria bacterium]|nr:hypothetical protein [Candidatus Eisenbacteria bacterium]
MHHRWLRFVGWFLILVGILCNPWLLARAFSPDGRLSQSTTTLIWVFETAAITLGTIFLLARRRAPPLAGAGNLYVAVALSTFNTLLLFGLANLAAFVLRSPRAAPASNFVSVEEMHARHPGQFRALMGGHTDEEIQLLLQPPNLTWHPTLEFMEGPVTSRFYNVGLENMRYTRFVNARNAREKIDGATWVMGGSTAFGHAVTDDETIAAYLNELDSGATYLNFAVEAYHQNLEIDKLLLLLKKGYRPSRVIFVDGLNDFTRMHEVPFAPAESPSRLSNAYGWGFNISSAQHPPASFIVRRLPLLDALLTGIESGRERRIPNSELDRDADLDVPSALYHVDPLLHYRAHARLAPDFDGAARDVHRYQTKILAYYSMNGRFLDRIAAAYGFDFEVFLQPLGPLSPSNAFHRDPVHYDRDPMYRYFAAMRDTVRAAIAAGELPHFYDISDADRGCNSCYVDFTHYSPRLCREIAVAILKDLPRSRRAVRAGRSASPMREK